jgi:predicted nucleic acid-binding protein
MAVLIDSDILIEVTRGRDEAILEKWHALAESQQEVLCSPVTVAELWHGARPSEHGALEALFSALRIVPIDREVGRCAGDHLHQYAKSHHVELGDALIAATAAIAKAELWTRNRKHYPMRPLKFW